MIQYALIQEFTAKGRGIHRGIDCRVTVKPGEPAPHRFAYVLAPVRLYRLDKGRYVEAMVHDRVAMLPCL